MHLEPIAMRQRQEDKAAKQLERVQAQNAEFIHPVSSILNHFCHGHIRLAYD